MDPSLATMNIPPDEQRYAMPTTGGAGSGPGSVEDGSVNATTGTDGMNLPARNVVADSANGSPAKTFKQDTPGGSNHHHNQHQHLHVASKDFARIPGSSSNDDLFRSLTARGATRPDLHRPYRMSEGGGGGYGQVYPTMMENRYMPSAHAVSFDSGIGSSSSSTFPRLNPLQGIHGYPSLQVGGNTTNATPISADRQTAHDAGIGMGMERAYNTPFALPGLHSSSVAESRMPPHLEQIAASGQSLIQLPLPPSMHMQDHSGGVAGIGYGGRITPMVSLLNDNKPIIDVSVAVNALPIDTSHPPIATTGASPTAAAADSPDHTSTSSGRAHGILSRVDGSSTSTGSNTRNPTRGSSPPIRPIEIRRFPFLSPAIGESGGVVGGRARSGLTPASLPNILNTSTVSGTGTGSGTGSSSKISSTELPLASGDMFSSSSGAGPSSPQTSKPLPSKFSSLHRMVADVPEEEDESEYEEYDDDDESSGEEASGRTRTTTIELSATSTAEAGVGKGSMPTQEYSMERKRKRRKLDPGGASAATAGIAEENDSMRLFRKDPVSVGYVTEHQARELFSMMGLFIINTIFAMQFNQILQITHEDPLVANSFDWHIGSNLPLVDLSLIASVQLRARFLHYKSLLEITAADADDLDRTDQSHTATLLSLSILTRTSNQDLGNINAHWVEQIREASPTGDIPIKPFIWLAGLRLHLNIVIMNQTIRIENSRRLQRNSLGSIAAFHHSINAACEVLTKMKMLPKRQLAFASDTLLHFTIYAGYFLFTVCTKSTRDLLEPEERQHCEDIVIEASQALASASLYPADAPALHARFLRRLTSPYLAPQDTLDPANGTGVTHDNGDNQVDSRDPNKQATAYDVHHQPEYNALPPNYNNPAPANGFQFAQEPGPPSNIPLADTIWGGTDDGLWTQFDGAWWDQFRAVADVMQDMTAKNAAKPMSSSSNLQQPS
ncbi:hypothetical protein QFC22_002139 [Naganishia vaughanmartiniae]|uniref:Uncharacterized protein n=1 Tax=Naganishia vaughanmartiniae TaxID=1424756 RepID=A0ACC2XD16_9TREE|nr:hypothetical protein QFC22_002139 [Naganishia vaughanmartiniae]